MISEGRHSSILRGAIGAFWQLLRVWSRFISLRATALGWSPSGGGFLRCSHGSRRVSAKSLCGAARNFWCHSGWSLLISYLLWRPCSFVTGSCRLQIFPAQGSISGRMWTLSSQTQCQAGLQCHREDRFDCLWLPCHLYRSQARLTNLLFDRTGYIYACIALFCSLLL